MNIPGGRTPVLSSPAALSARTGIEESSCEERSRWDDVCVCSVTLRVLNTCLCLTYLFTFSVSVQGSRRVSVEYQCEVEHIFTSEEFLVSSKQTPKPDTGGNSSYFSNSSFAPRFPLFFSPSLLTPPLLFFSPSRILAGLRPADQW